MHHPGARRTLVAVGDKDRALSVRAALNDNGRHADLTGSLADALALLERREHDSLVLSLTLPDADAIACVRAVCERRPGLAIVVVDEADVPETALAVLEAGAQDYLGRGDEQRLGGAVERAVARAGIVERLYESEIRYRTMLDVLPGCIAVSFDRRLGVTTLDGQAPLSDFRLDYPGQPAEEVFGVEKMRLIRPNWERTLAGEAFSSEWRSTPDDRTFVSHFAPVNDALGHLLGGVVVGIDVHDQLEAESGLAAYRRRHSELAEGVPIGIAEFAVDGVCRYINGRYSEITGVPVDDALGRLWSEFAHPDDVQPMIEEWETAKAAGREFRLDYRIRRADGGFVWVAARAREFRDEHGQSAGYLQTISDIEQRRRADQALREATALFTAAFEQAPVAMVIFGIDGRYQQVNQAACSLFGRPPEELVGRFAEEFVHPDHHEESARAIAAMASGESDEWETEGRAERADGSHVWTLTRTTVLRTEEGEPTLLFAQMVDIGERRDQEIELQRLADHDPLTGLYNRRCFEAELGRHLTERSRAGDSGAVLLLDLDRFKRVNDAHGHRAGDQVLVRVADVLRRRLRRDDVAGRIGGDEFAVLLREGDEAGARAVADMLSAAIAETGTTVSIGLAAIEGGEGSTEEVLVRADQAMYEVKRRGIAQEAATHPRG